ncbi:MAG: type II toxin-antitoxin system RelE/ParE family toxin [Opitutales bacterium]|jgi:mRNA-degrading endonuclease RelE of RelBE toxin-antitoxin system|nr:type II toxin-antitoxin system RelE/ParE family toxin [Opitutales bacterium]MDP4777416.1 type II toxin-antitoxin system RelE/ParE family toxin [Opitutales bacterium]MDP5080241.1 type II toxin-antitoxin system RelE/ParE family toxin [Opitutales bacterium]
MKKRNTPLDKRKIYISAAFGRKVKKLQKQEKKELDNAVLDILNDPSIGEDKVGDLSGVSVHKFKMNKHLTLLSYTYDSADINLLTFGSHENFYRELKKYKKA